MHINNETFEILLLIIGSIFIGMGKGGIPGAGMVAIPIFAFVFGGKPSTGYVLPLLILADSYAVYHYHKDIKKKHLFMLLPWALGGVLIALFVGNHMNNAQFIKIIAIVIFVSLLLVLARDLKFLNLSLEKNNILAIVLGLFGGFASMIGNAAGPITSLYFLSMGFKKNEFIVTAAGFYFVLNILKLPLHIFVWETITLHTFQMTLILIPFIFLGVFAGIKLSGWLPEKIFTIIVYITTFGSLLLILL